MAKSEYDETRRVQKPPTDDVARVAKMSAYMDWRGEWVACAVCGLLCPGDKYEGYTNIHISCSYTDRGKTYMKAQKRETKKEKIAATKVAMF